MAAIYIRIQTSTTKPAEYEAGRVVNVYRKTVEAAHFVATVST